MTQPQIPPWLTDKTGATLWVRPSLFAIVINRSTRRVFQMLNDGSIQADFGYPVYRDRLGAWYIRISQLEYDLARSLKARGKSHDSGTIRKSV